MHCVNCRDFLWWISTISILLACPVYDIFDSLHVTYIFHILFYIVRKCLILSMRINQPSCRVYFLMRSIYLLSKGLLVTHVILFCCLITQTICMPYIVWVLMIMLNIEYVVTEPAVHLMSNKCQHRKDVSVKIINSYWIHQNLHDAFINWNYLS